MASLLSPTATSPYASLGSSSDPPQTVFQDLLGRNSVNERKTAHTYNRATKGKAYSTALSQGRGGGSSVSSIRGMPWEESRQRGEVHKMLKRCVGNVLKRCLAELCEAKPEDPIEFIAHWLYRHVDSRIYLQEKAAYLRALDAAAARMKAEMRRRREHLASLRAQALEFSKQLGPENMSPSVLLLTKGLLRETSSADELSVLEDLSSGWEDEERLSGSQRESFEIGDDGSKLQRGRRGKMTAAGEVFGTGGRRSEKSCEEESYYDPEIGDWVIPCDRASIFGFPSKWMMEEEPPRRMVCVHAALGRLSGGQPSIPSDTASLVCDGSKLSSEIMAEIALLMAGCKSNLQSDRSSLRRRQKQCMLSKETLTLEEEKEGKEEEKEDEEEEEVPCLSLYDHETYVCLPDHLLSRGGLQHDEGVHDEHSPSSRSSSDHTLDVLSHGDEILTEDQT